jgi:hypothetical protein
MNMGYDNRHVIELVIPEDKVAETNKLLVEYYKKNDCEYYVPGIRIYENAYGVDDVHIGLQTELTLYDRCPYLGGGIDMPDEILDCAVFGEEYDENMVGWLHNDNAVELLSPVIEYLKENGVLISGWIFTDYESTDVYYNFWVDGEEVYARNEIGVARVVQKMLIDKHKKE